MEHLQPIASHSEKKKIMSEVTQTHGNDGVDLTLIRWMLSMSPEERLQVLQDAVRSVVRLQNARPVA